MRKVGVIFIYFSFIYHRKEIVFGELCDRNITFEVTRDQERVSSFLRGVKELHFAVSTCVKTGLFVSNNKKKVFDAKICIVNSKVLPHFIKRRSFSFQFLYLFVCTSATRFVK